MGHGAEKAYKLGHLGLDVLPQKAGFLGFAHGRKRALEDGISMADPNTHLKQASDPKPGQVAHAQLFSSLQPPIVDQYQKGLPSAKGLSPLYRKKY